MMGCLRYLEYLHLSLVWRIILRVATQTFPQGSSLLVGCSIEDNGGREYGDHFTAHANTLVLEPTATKDYHKDLAEVLDTLCLP